MKVFIGLVEVAGYCSNLKKGFEDIGVKSCLIDLSNNPYKYSGNHIHTVVKWIYWLNSHKNKGVFFKLTNRLLRLMLFIWAVIEFDVFVFASGASFFKYDLPVLKWLHKKIIVVYLGSDSRPPYLNGIYINKNSISELITLTNQQKKAIVWTEKWADRIINYIPHAHFNEKPIVLGDYIGFPYSSKEVKIGPADRMKNRISILHCPSRPEIKGTQIIENIIQKLKDEGYDLELKKIIGQPNEVVLSNLMSCDFVVDEVYADSPVGALSTEAASFEKPTVVGGYYADHKIDSRRLLTQKGATLYCNPDLLEDNIKKMAENRELRKSLGLAANSFVTTEWSPQQVALRYLQLINNDFPPEWLFDPKQITYLHGYGVSEQHLRATIAEIIIEGGIEALQLSDKPELSRLFMDFCALSEG